METTERMRHDRQALVGRVDAVLEATLAAERVELAGIEPGAAALIDELTRLIQAGGKRLRPAFCYWGYRAAGGEDHAATDEPIVRAAASLELLHTMALIHDDLMDGALERRGVPASALAMEARGGPAAPAGYGRSAAILVGDLAAVLADRLFLASGFSPDRLAAALDRYHTMRVRMAAGQYLDVAGLAARPEAARRAARLKGGAYTVDGPLRVGAALVGSSPEIESVLDAFGEPLGIAFQLRDDLEDLDASHDATADEINGLIEEACGALAGTTLAPGTAEALAGIAHGLEVR